MVRIQVPGLLTGILGTFIATGVLLVLRTTSGSYVVEEWEKAILWLGWTSLVVFGAILAYRSFALLVARWLTPRLRQQIAEELKPQLSAILEKEFHSRLLAEIGLDRIYSGFPACQQEILEAIQNSKSVQIFLQIGRTVLQGGANFYDELAKNLPRDADLQILHASPDNPYLSERAAFSRQGGGKMKFDEWQMDTGYATERLEGLYDEHLGSGIDSRQHMEGFIWRLFILDNVAYAQPYLYERNNSRLAPVLRFCRLHEDSSKVNPSSLYHTFANYFSLKWDEATPQSLRLRDIVAADQQCAVAAVVRYHQFFVFAVPSRYISRPDRELPFHGIGGKRGPGEDWLDALRREAAEEVQAELSISSSGMTRYLTSGAEHKSIRIEDTPRPYCIYKRTRGTDPNFDNDVLWLVGYDSEIQVPNLESIKPGSEIGALVIMTGEVLKRTLHDHLTYEELAASREVSRVVVAPGVKFDLRRVAIPSGLATIVATQYRSRLVRRL